MTPPGGPEGLLLTGAAAALGLVAAPSVAYLLALLGGAVLPRRPAPAPGAVSGQEGGQPWRVAVIVPAHNEEEVLDATLTSLLAQDYPAALTEIVVVADNCTDRTAAVARRRGVAVLERTDDARRGKGYALQWAVERLLEAPGVADAFLVVDADTEAAPDFVRVITGRLRAGQDGRGRCALQGRYGVLNGRDGWRAGLMAAAFDLCNHVKPLGADRLGLSVDLKGNGMGFTRAVLSQAPWSGRSVTEDIDYGLDLLQLHGVRVGYAPDAAVRAQMPVTAGQAASQRERWEGGRYGLARRRALPLLTKGLLRRDVRLCEAGFRLAAPPLAETGAVLLLWQGVVAAGVLRHTLPGAAVWEAAVLACAAGMLLYVLGGLRAAGAPPAAYAALCGAPLYAIWKFALYAASPLRRRSRANGGWVRTERVAPTGGGIGGRP